MRLSLNRKGKSLSAQLTMQIAMKILSGEIARGEMLPSVRALAQQLHVHRNTISAAYKKLRDMHLIDSGRGAGVLVTRGARRKGVPAQGFEDHFRVGLQKAVLHGHSMEDMRAALHAWSSAAFQAPVVVVDSTPQTAMLLAEEIRARFQIACSTCSLAEAVENPHRLAGSVTVTVPVHLDQLPPVAFEGVVAVAALDFSPAAKDTITRLPPGSIVLGLSCSLDVLPYASALLRSCRDDDIIIECYPVSDHAWLRLVPAADVIFADVLAAPMARQAGATRVHEVTLLSAVAAADIQAAVAFWSLRAHLAETAGDPGAK